MKINHIIGEDQRTQDLKQQGLQRRLRLQAPAQQSLRRSHYYFAYGRNTNHDIMLARTRDSQDLGAAVLPNYSMEFHYFADVVANPGHQVHGVLWTMTVPGLRDLDRREGYPRYYDRILRQVHLADGGSVAAWVYVMRHSRTRARLWGPAPPDSYIQDMTLGYQQHGLPTQQIRQARQRALQRRPSSADSRA